MAKNNGEVIYIVPLLIMADPDDHSLIPVASSALDISDYPLYVEMDPEADYNPLLMYPQNQQWQVLELSAVSRLLMDPILDCIFEEDEEQVDEDDEVSGMAAVAGAGAPWGWPSRVGARASCSGLRLWSLMMITLSSTVESQG